MRAVIILFIFIIPFCLIGQTKKISAKSLLSKKLKTNDTLFITFLKSGETDWFEKLGITKLADGRYKALQYNGTSIEIVQDFTVPSTVYESVIKAEKDLKKKSKTTCKDMDYVFKLKKKYYSIAENNCDNPTMDKIKAQLFLVQGK